MNARPFIGVVKVQAADFDPAAEQQALIGGRQDIGAVVTFTGLVRDMAEDKPIERMTLEHYPGMTEKQLERILAEAQRRWPLDAGLILHRYGPLGPGERIVLVIAASAHRQAAFEACAFLVDWLKTQAPFWKLEEGEAGRNWVEAKSSDDEAARRWAPAKPAS